MNSRSKWTNYMETREPLQDKDLNLTPLTRLGNLRMVFCMKQVYSFNRIAVSDQSTISFHSGPQFIPITCLHKDI